MVQKINPHPALGRIRSPPTMYFQKMQFLGVFRPFLQRSFSIQVTWSLVENEVAKFVHGFHVLYRKRRTDRYEDFITLTLAHSEADSYTG